MSFLPSSDDVTCQDDAVENITHAPETPDSGKRNDKGTHYKPFKSAAFK